VVTFFLSSLLGEADLESGGVEGISKVVGKIFLGAVAIGICSGTGVQLARQYVELNTMLSGL